MIERFPKEQCIFKEDLKVWTDVWEIARLSIVPSESPGSGVVSEVSLWGLHPEEGDCGEPERLYSSVDCWKFSPPWELQGEPMLHLTRWKQFTQPKTEPYTRSVPVNM